MSRSCRQCTSSWDSWKRPKSARGIQRECCNNKRVPFSCVRSLCSRSLLSIRSFPSTTYLPVRLDLKANEKLLPPLYPSPSVRPSYPIFFYYYYYSLLSFYFFIFLRAVGFPLSFIDVPTLFLYLYFSFLSFSSFLFSLSFLFVSCIHQMRCTITHVRTSALISIGCIVLGGRKEETRKKEGITSKDKWQRKKRKGWLEQSFFFAGLILIDISPSLFILSWIWAWIHSRKEIGIHVPRLQIPIELKDSLFIHKKKNKKEEE